MKLYYEEATTNPAGSIKVNYFEIEHDQRHLIWKNHPHAKEVSRTYYFKIMDQVKEKEI